MTRSFEFQLIIICMISLINQNVSYPVPQQLIDGNDFLSIYMNQNREFAKNEVSKVENQMKFKDKIIEDELNKNSFDNQQDDELSMEESKYFDDTVIISSDSNLNNNKTNTTNNDRKSEIYFLENPPSSEESSIDSHTNNDKIIDDNNFIKIVKTGSTIIFLDEINGTQENESLIKLLNNDYNINASNNASSSNDHEILIDDNTFKSLMSENITNKKNENESVTEIINVDHEIMNNTLKNVMEETVTVDQKDNDTIPASVKQPIKLNNSSVDYRITVSVSTSEKETKVNVTKPIKWIIEKNPIFSSNSQKSEFSIDEQEPLTNPDVDSMKQESINIPSIASPFDPANNHQYDDSKLVLHRVQRKQNPPVNPIQTETLIVHDSQSDDTMLNEKDPNEKETIIHTNNTIDKDKDSDDNNNNTNDNNNDQNIPNMYSQPAKIYSEQSKIYGMPSKFYSEPAKIYSEPSKIYSEPSKMYGEPEKIYSEPSKIYSEPSKIYSEPSKIYSIPSKIYGEPSKIYSLPPSTVVESVTVTPARPKIRLSSTSQTNDHQDVQHRNIIFNLDKLPYDLLNAPIETDAQNPLRVSNTITRFNFKQLHKHYENQKKNELVNSTVMDAMEQQMHENNQQLSEFKDNITLSPATPSKTNSNSTEHFSPFSSEEPEVGYVIEVNDSKKYRVEEKTPEGFIIGEYAIVSNIDGDLRGVRYTALSDINPDLIYDTLVKFLAL